jgi:hypothetical protein
MNPIKRIIKLERIDIKASPNVRAEMNGEAVIDYAESYLEKQNVPEIVLFEWDNAPLMIADGKHRLKAMEKAGIKERACLIYKGGYEACLKYALRANLFHGLRRTNEDKRSGVELALKTFPDKSNGVLAEMAAVGESLVSEIRKEMEGSGKVDKSSERTGKDGRKRRVGEKFNSTNRGVEGSQNHENQGKSKDSILELRDKTGFLLTQNALKYWNRSEEVESCLDSAKSIRKVVAEALEKDDRLFSADIRNTFLTEIDNIIIQLKACVPYAVCPYCQGKLSEKCTFCKQRGIVGEHLYHAIPPELKKIREAASKKP